jgi:hypothetical protein
MQGLEGLDINGKVSQNVLEVVLLENVRPPSLISNGYWFFIWDKAAEEWRRPLTPSIAEFK